MRPSKKGFSLLSIKQLILAILFCTTIYYICYKISSLENKLNDIEIFYKTLREDSTDNVIDYSTKNKNPISVGKDYLLEPGKGYGKKDIGHNFNSKTAKDSFVVRETCTSEYKRDANYFMAAKIKNSAHDISVHKISDIVSSSIQNNGVWEEEISNRLITHFSGRKQNIFVDIGGNIGYFTSLIAFQGQRVIVVEPFKLNVPLILNTICELNPQFADNVFLYKYAMSNISGLEYCIWSTNSVINNGNARVVPAFSGTKSFGEDKDKVCMEKIKTMRLDDILFSSNGGYYLNERIWGLKIDIEGYEALAMAGASRLMLSNFSPCIIWFEYQKDVTIQSGATEYALFELLSRVGYTIYIVPAFSELPERKREMYTTMVTAPDWGNLNIGDFEARLENIEECKKSLIYNEYN